MKPPPPLAESHHVALGAARTPYVLERTRRRTLEIAVTPDGRVEVRAPLELPLARIEARLHARARWLRRRLEERELARPALVPRSFSPGETHRYLGRQYRLSIRPGARNACRLSGGRLVVEVDDVEDASSVKRTLERWYRGRARIVLPARMERFLSLPSFHGLRPRAVRVQSMRQRWGSCSSSGGLLLNSLLVRLPVSLIDYVIVHELCHLRVRSHGPEFERQLARALPDWRTRHRELLVCRLD